MGLFNFKPATPTIGDLSIGTILIVMANVPKINVGQLDDLLNENPHFFFKNRDYLFDKVLPIYNKFHDEVKWLEMFNKNEPFLVKMVLIQLYSLMLPHIDTDEGVNKVFALIEKTTGYTSEQLKELWYEEIGQYE